MSKGKLNVYIVLCFLIGHSRNMAVIAIFKAVLVIIFGKKLSVSEPGSRCLSNVTNTTLDLHDTNQGCDSIES